MRGRSLLNYTGIFMSRRNHTKHTPKAAPDLVWDSLRNMGMAAAQLGRLPGRLAPLLRNQQIMQNVNDHGQLLVLINSVSSDVTVLSDQLKLIYSRHSTRTGSSRNPNDLMSALMVGEDYINWCTHFHGIVIPVVMDILEQIGDASQEAGVEVSAIVNEIKQTKAILTSDSLPKDTSVIED
jgi:hypothetical protein